MVWPPALSVETKLKSVNVISAKNRFGILRYMIYSYSNGTAEFEELGGKYERQGDYLIPCLIVPAEEEQPIGIWGQRHFDYLKQYRKVRYTNPLTSGRSY